MMKKRALFAVSPEIYQIVYAGYPRRRMDELVEVIGGPLHATDVKHFDRLNEVELLFASWSSPTLDQDLLAAMPHLRAVFYGAGSIRNLVSEAFWARSIPITSAYAANAIPVAEFAFAAILLSLKRVWHYERSVRHERAWPAFVPMSGAFRSTVGLVSLGAIGRLVAGHLKNTEVQVIAYDPFVKAEVAQELGVRLVTLEEVFQTADVVSLHTPHLKETEGLVGASLLRAMKPGATLINTARGAVICESELIATLQERPDLTAMLDVTWPATPPRESPLYDLPNAVLTPHIAGSMGEECKRMGSYMVDELERFLRDEPLRWRITREQMARMA